MRTQIPESRPAAGRLHTVRRAVRLARAVLLLAGLAKAGVSLYRNVLREPILNWGATADEIARVLPGDELLGDPDIIATRAITIDAPAAAIWPWLLQMGPGRGGAYTYDFIENLFGLDMHSADRIIPEYQHLAVGDVVRNPQGGGMRVEIIEPERVLATRSEAGDWVWIFALFEEDGHTRFLSRNRIAMTGDSAGQRLGMLLMEPGSLVMERKMLLGIKERAERLAGEQRRESAPSAA